MTVRGTRAVRRGPAARDAARGMRSAVALCALLSCAAALSAYVPAAAAIAAPLDCPDGEIYDERSDRCISGVPVGCAPGSAWDDSTQRCRRTINVVCPEGTMFNGLTRRCMRTKTVTCPEGSLFNRLNRRCMRTTGLACPEGTVMDERSRKCLRTTVVGCPEGFYMDGRTRQCLRLNAVGCPPGSTLDLLSWRCIRSVAVTCSDGYALGPDERCQPMADLCPDGAIFDEVSQRCLRATSIACPEGSMLDSLSQQCMRTATVTCSDGFVLGADEQCVPIADTCPGGSVFDTVTQRCLHFGTLACAEHWRFDSESQQCVPDCPEGTAFDDQQQRCVELGCPIGAQYDEISATCVRAKLVFCEAGTSYDAVHGECRPVVVTCPSGSRLDEASSRCLRVVAVVCPEDFLLDDASKSCVQPTTCPQGLVVDTLSQRCLMPPRQLRCGSGETLERSSQTCVGINPPACPGTAQWDSVTSRCITFMPVACPVGRPYDGPSQRCGCPTATTWDSLSSRCITFEPVACPVGMHYDGASQRCGCPAATRWDSLSSRCIAFEPVACPVGMHYDGASQRCGCPVATRWDSFSSRCTAFTPVACPAGRHYDAASQRCMCPVAMMSVGVWGRCVAAARVRCSRGLVFDHSSQACVTAPCGSGSGFDELSMTCKSMVRVSCSAGSRLDSVSMTCVRQAPVWCAAGHRYDASTSRCVVQCGPGATYDDTTQECACPAGSRLVEATQRCVRMVRVTCPQGFTYSEEAVSCVQATSCPSGQSYIASLGSCVPSCTAGQALNLATGSCSARGVRVSCPAGRRFSLSVHRCLRWRTVTCMAGHVFDEQFMRCRPVCDVGKSSYDADAQACIDSTPPTVSASWQSDNSRSPLWAALGDEISVTVQFDEAVPAPVVTIGGIPADEVVAVEAAVSCSVDPHAHPVFAGDCDTEGGVRVATAFVATFAVSESASGGEVPVAIEGLDAAGNAFSFSETQGSTGVGVSIDVAAPQLVAATWRAEAGSFNSEHFVADGGTVRIRCLTDELILAPNAIIGGIVVSPAAWNVIGSDELGELDELWSGVVTSESTEAPQTDQVFLVSNAWEAFVVIDASVPEGLLGMVAAITDLYGNALQTEGFVDSLSTSVTVDNTPSQVIASSLSSTTSPAVSVATHGDAVLVSIELSESVPAGGVTVDAGGETVVAFPVGDPDCSVDFGGDDQCDGPFTYGHFEAELEIESSVADGPISVHAVAQDVAGNLAETTFSEGTDGSVVVVDTVAASWEVTWTSDSLYHSFAAAHATVSIHLQASEPVDVPVVRVQGEVANAAGTGDRECRGAESVADGSCDSGWLYETFSASFLLDDSVSEGLLLVKVEGAADVARVPTATFSGHAGADGLGVNFDPVVPSWMSATWTSDYIDPHSARVGSVVTVTIVASEAVFLPQVRISTVGFTTFTLATVTDFGDASCPEGVPSGGCGYRFTAEYTLSAEDEDGELWCEIAGPADFAGNIGEALGNGGIIFDKTAPTVNSVVFASDHPLSDRLARPGHTVTLDLIVSEAVSATPLVLINGHEAGTVDSGELHEYRSQWTLTETDEPGWVEVEIDNMSDEFSNEGVLWIGTTGTRPEESRVWFDPTAPALVSVTWQSGDDDRELARVGSVVTVLVTANEPVSTPTVTVQGQPAVLAASSEASCEVLSPCGYHTEWTATYELALADATGMIDVQVSGVVDEVGWEAPSFAGSSGTDGTGIDFRAAVLPVAGSFDFPEYRTGDIAVVSVSFDNDIQSAVATAFDRPASVTTAAAEVEIIVEFRSGDPAGMVEFELIVTDANGNSALFNAAAVINGLHGHYVRPRAELSVDEEAMGGRVEGSDTYSSRTIVIVAVFDELVSDVDASAFLISTETDTMVEIIEVTGDGLTWRLSATLGAPLVPTLVAVSMPESAGSIEPPNSAALDLIFGYAPVYVEISYHGTSPGFIEFLVEFSRAVNDVSADDFSLDASGMGLPLSASLSVFNFNDNDNGDQSSAGGVVQPYESVYLLTVEMGTVDRVRVLVSLPQAAGSIWPEPAGPTSATADYDCGGSEIECIHETEYFAVPSGDIRLNGNELHASRFPMSFVEWEYFGATDERDEPVWTDDGAGMLDIVGDVPGGLHVWRLTATDIGGVHHSVRIGVDVSALSITSPAPEEPIYAGETLTVEWDTLRFQPSQYVRVSIRADFDGDRTTTPLEVVDSTTVLASRLSWQWSVPARPDLEPSYSVHVVAVASLAPVAPRDESEGLAMVVPAEAVPSAWSECDAPCGVGEQTRTIDCLDVRTGDRLSINACSRYATLPTVVQSCEQGECIDPSWTNGPWSSCSKSCGGGTKSRTVTCVQGADTLDEDSCDASTRPVSDISCNTFPCETYFWRAGSWSSCSADCGDGFEERDIMCIAETTQVPVQDSNCDASLRDEIEWARPCNLGSCDVPWFELGDWSVCSKSCGGGNSFRSVLCWFNGETPSAPSTAEDCVSSAFAMDITVPSPVKVCNSAPCVSYSYLVGDWSVCSTACGGGTRSRTLECAMTGGGSRVMVDVSECITNLPAHVVTPQETSSCNTQPCDVNFCNTDEPCNQRGTCDPTDGGACTCFDGYSGLRCETTEGCPEGSIQDSAGECCESRVLDSEFQLCCEGENGASPLLDDFGACCPSGFLDVCGECDGAAVAVDATGECCDTLLDASGLCCHSGFVDTCGVCDGTNSCPTVALLGAQLGDGMSVEDAYDAGIVDNFSDEVRAALGLDDTYSVGVTLEGSGSDGEAAARMLAAQRSLQGQDVVMEVTIVPLESTTETGLERRMFGISSVEVAGISPGAVESVGRQPECGNGVCETGERCSSVDDGECCALDCPYLLKSCPTGEGFSTVCSGRGRCSSGTGECSCFGGSGYTGDACDECAEGFQDMGNGECRTVVVPDTVPSDDGIAGQEGPIVTTPVDSADSTSLIAGLVSTAVVLVCCCGLFRLYSMKQKSGSGPDVPEFVKGAADDMLALGAAASTGSGDAKTEELAMTTSPLQRPPSKYVLNPSDPTTLERKETPPGRKETQGRAVALSSSKDESPSHGASLDIKRPAPQLEVGIVTATTIPLMWDEPEYAGRGGARITGYKVSYVLDSTRERFTHHTNSTEPAFVIGGAAGTPAPEPLTPGTCVRDVTVVACNEAGESRDALQLELVKSLDVPSQCTNLAVVATTSTTAMLTWSSPADDGGGRIVSYDVSYTDQAGEQRVTSTGSSEGRFTLGNGSGEPAVAAFNPGSHVTAVVVRAVNAAGPAAWSDAIEDIVLVDLPPSTPTNLVVGDVGLHTVPISWTIAVEASVTVHRVSYVLDGKRVSVNTLSALPEFVIGSEAGSPASEPIPAGSEVYDISVVAVSDSGSSEASAPIRIATTLRRAGRPSSVRVVAVTGSTVRLEWLPPNDDGGSAVVDYNVTYRLQKEGKKASTHHVRTMDTATTFMIGGEAGQPESQPLDEGVAVSRITVVAVTRAGAGQRSTPPLQATTVAPPGPPMDVQVREPKRIGGGIGDDYVAVLPVTWLPPIVAESTDVSQSAILRYVVSYRVNGERMRVSVRNVVGAAGGPGESKGSDEDAAAAHFGDSKPDSGRHAFAVGRQTFAIGSGAGIPASTALPLGAEVTDICVAGVSVVGQGQFSEHLSSVMPAEPPAPSHQMPSAPPAAVRTHTVPTAPTDLVADDNRTETVGTIRLTWLAPTDDVGLPVTTYKVACLVDGEARVATVTPLVTAAGLCEFLIGGGGGIPASAQLEPATVVSAIEVSAQNFAGTGPAATVSEEIVLGAPAPAAPSRPAVIRVVAPTQTVTLAWTNPVVRARRDGKLDESRMTPQDEISAYEVQWKPVAGWAKAVHAAGLDRRFGDVLCTEAPSAELSSAEVRELFLRRSVDAQLYPTWFDDAFMDQPEEWELAETREVADTGSAVQSKQIALPPGASYEFRVRCRNGYGEWGPWSDEGRPVFVPHAPRERPARRQVKGLEVPGGGSGWEATTDELQRFIVDNLEADKELGVTYSRWVTGALWATVREWCSSSQIAQRRVHTELRKRGLPVRDAAKRAATWARVGDARGFVARQKPQGGRVSASPARSEVGAAVRASRAVWVPVVRSAAAGRPGLLAMLPSISSPVAAAVRGEAAVGGAGRLSSRDETHRERARSGPLAAVRAKGTVAKGSTAGDSSMRVGGGGAGGSAAASAAPEVAADRAVAVRDAEDVSDSEYWV